METEERALTYAALILADAGHYISADKIRTLTDAANMHVEPMLAELLTKALGTINIQRTLLGHPSTSLRYFSLLPDELVLQIARCAGEVVPDELLIRHPADGLDPLFVNGKLAPKYTWRAKWKEALVTRLNIVKVCRRFRRIATPVLYSSYFTYSDDQVTSFISAIRDNPHLGHHIRRLDFSIRHYTYITISDIQDLLRFCPNLIILSLPAPRDPDCLPTSLRSLQVKSRLNHHHDWDVAKVLRRLEHLERLSLRMNLLPANGWRSRGDRRGMDLDRWFHPSLRTVCFEGNIPEKVIEMVMPPENSIQSIQIRKLGQHPAGFLTQYVRRAEFLTHLSLPHSWVEFIPANFSIPTLRHIHIQASLGITGISLDCLCKIGPVTSLGRTFRDGTLSSTLEWIRPLTVSGDIVQMSPKFKHIYTDRKSLKKSGYLLDSPELVRDWARETELRVAAGSGVEWHVQSGANVVAVRDILEEIEGEPVEESDEDMAMDPFD